MTTPRQPGEIRPGDRVITRDRARETGTLVALADGDAEVAFDGDAFTLTVPVRTLARHWDVRRICSRLGRGPFRVEARHPQHGFLPRGRIRPVGVEGHSIRWSVQNYDHEMLPEVVGDYMAAERALLEATAELDETAPADQLTT